MLASLSNSFCFGRRPLRIITPVNIGNGFVWLNADLGSVTNFGSLLTDGATVTTWKDAYAGSHDANKAGNASVKPIWKSNIQNGLGVVRFDGVNDSLNINPVNSPSPTLQGAAVYTLFVVSKASTLSASKTLTSTDTGGFKIFHDGTQWGVATSNGTGIATGLSGDTTKFHIFTVQYNGSLSGNSNRLKFRYDSIDQTLNFGATTVGSTTNATASYLYIGQDAAGTVDNFFHGDIAEIVLYVRSFTTSEVQAEESYLKAHWNI